MARPPAPKRRRTTAQELVVEGDDDWSDELSSLPASDEESEGSSDSGSDDEDDVIDMLKDPSSSKSSARNKSKTSASGVEVVLPLVTPGAEDAPARRKRGRPRKEPEPKVPKKRGRPRKYAPGEKRPRKSRRKLNPDGSFKKRGRPKKVIDPNEVKVPKRRGRPPKVRTEGEEDPRSKRAGTGGAKKKKREFDLLAGLDLEFDGEDAAAIVPGVGAGDDDGWQDEADSPRKQDDILAKLRRRILYRQQDAELQDFIDSLGTDRPPDAAASAVNPAENAAVEEEDTKPDVGPRPGLPLPRSATDPHAASSIPSADKRKERRPFEADTQSNEAMSALASAAASAAAETEQQAAQAKPKGRPPGSKNRRPDWENNPLLTSYRASTDTASTDRGLSLYGSAAGASAGAANGANLVKPTSSDAYFLFNTSKRARGLAGMEIGSSSNLISSKLPALDARSLERTVAEQTRPGASISDLASRMYSRLLPVYLAQLLAGYAIIFHGVGNKTKLLTELVSNRTENEGDAVGVVAQGAMKGFKVEDMLAEIERAVGLGPLTVNTAALARGEEDGNTASVVSTLTAARAERVVRRFSGKKESYGPTKLFLILDTFDAPGMQSIRFKSVLEALARSKDIHIMATTEHVNSGFIAAMTGQQASTSSFHSTGHGQGANGDGPHRPVQGGGRLCWIWQNMSTYTPSLDEMLIMRSNPAFSSWMPALPPALDLIGSAASVVGQGVHAGSAQTGSGAAGQDAAGVAYYSGLQVSDAFRTVSEASAISILKSVTQKARALFTLLAKQCLSASTDADTVGQGGQAGLGGVAYTELLKKAQRSFVASSEADFKSLLIEFKDHHLCHLSKQGILCIGLADAKVLQSVLDRLRSI